MVTINSDDPPMFTTDLGHEFEIAHADLGFSFAELKRAILTSLEASWLDETTKRQWFQSGVQKSMPRLPIKAGPARADK